MCFRMQGGSPLTNPLNTELKNIWVLGSFSPYFSAWFSAKKNTWFSFTNSLVSLNLKSKPKYQTQLASKHRFLKPRLKIKQVLIGYHHIIFPINFHFTSLSNLKTSKKSANLVRTSFFWLWKFTQILWTFFWNANWSRFLKKNTPFKVPIKHPDNKFGKIWVVKIERFGYKLKLNLMRNVPP